MKFCLMDFETASACDLKKSGAWVYAEHPTTEIICLGFTIDGDNNECWTPGPYEFDNSREALMVKAALADPAVIFIAHNCAFEKAIWRRIMVEQLGWPDIPNDRWHDSMASCAMKGIPLKLERALLVLRLSNQKDTEGTRETLSYSRTNRRGFYDRSPEKTARIIRYCRSDISGELELHRRVRGLGASERQVWLLDQEINERGVRLDMDFVRQAQRIVDSASVPLVKEFRELTGIEKIGSPKFKDWLQDHGLSIPDLKKETIDKLLGDDNGEEVQEESLAGDEEGDYDEARQIDVPSSCRRPLFIRKILGSASIKKLGAMQACCCADGNARGLLQYHGAGPGRWAGRLLQPQNFPRPSLKVQVGWNDDGTEKFSGHDPRQLVEAIMSGDAEYVRMIFGEPLEAIANGLRHAIVARPGNLLEVGDFAQVEARIVLAIAGQHDKTEMLAKGFSPYIPMAESIFKRKIDKHVDIKEYTIGKNTVLGCGFQMGAAKFNARYCPNESREFAQRAIDAYRKEFAPEVPKLWYALEDAAVKCVWDRRRTEAYGIQYNLEDGWLTARLPSGRKLWYYDPRPVRKPMPWDVNDIRPGFEYSALKMGQWKRISAYGGLLTENVVQATARDLLVNGMFNSRSDGHTSVLTVHDELINDVDEALADANLLNQYMCDIPQWARELRIPISADCWVDNRYRK